MKPTPNSTLNNTTTSCSTSTNTSHGQFNGHSVTTGTSPTNTINLETHMVSLATSEISSFGIEIPENENTPLIALQGDDPAELISVYVESYISGIFSFNPNSCHGIVLSNIINGAVSQLKPSIYNRLSKIGLACSNIPGYENKVILPMLKNDECNIIDAFGWFGSNTEVDAKFMQISTYFKLLSSLANQYYHKVEGMKYNPVVSFLSKKTLTHHQNPNSGIKSGIAKTESLNPSNNQWDISKKDKAAGNIIKIGTNESNMSSPQRMQAKLHALKDAEEIDCENKAKVLTCLKHLEVFWSIPSQIHPSKIQAYMIFENLLNHTYDVLEDFYNFSYVGQYTDIIKDHLSRTFCLFLHSLEMLLPYANEVTKAMGINLSKDPSLTKLLKIKEIIPRSLNEEFQECEEVKAELVEIKRKKALEKAKQQPKSPQVQTLTAPKKDQSISLTLAERKIENTARKEQAQVNKRLAAQRAKEVQTAKEQAEKDRGVREKEKAKVLSNRKLTQAQMMALKHKQEELALEEAKTKARLESQTKVHDLPSDILVQTIISKLKGRHALVFQMLFGEIDNHNTMNDTDVVNLASYLMDRLTQNGIGCGRDFYNYVVSRIHRRHDEDTGDLLPRDYCYILAACLIIFNIKPKGWVPKTKEDFDAEEKLLRRKADAIYWSNKV